MKKLMTIACATTVSIMALTGCGAQTETENKNNAAANSPTPPAAAEQVKFSFYFTGSQNVKDLWDTLVPMFEKENPTIDVEAVYLPSGTGAQPTYDRILAAKQAGKGSGGIDLYEDGINVVSQGGKEDVWETLSADAIKNLGNVNAKTMQDVKQFAVPYRASAVVLAYNSEKVANPPKTLDELLEWIHSNPGKFAYNDPSTGGSGSSFVNTVLYNGLPEEAIHNSDPSVMSEWDKGFKVLKDLGKDVYGKGIYPKKNQGTLDLLQNGEVDMIPAWSDMALQQLNEKLLPEYVKLQQITPGFNGGPTYLMVNKLSDKKEAVYQFLNFVLSPEAQEVIVDKMNGFPGIELSHMSQEVQDKFSGVAEGFRSFNLGELDKEINKRWQSEVAAQ
ncbi:extracellular solute-binding protein [Paenibacillus sp. NPDC058071]|uniref:extracellular solute-binding protein n=1 Tax=Paenibacillus sp. NPDC058071 TaxID=3346326 RepID=UPI0036DB7DA1